ncbi:hypothetical protein [Actinoplanes flavus]|uniref:Uncharacterized protein n=1 Tax=Actinoplanes flavus TaxID=2820290 RepID=A0ABS3UZI1_9ACTN|nr:hypothetical protein [Actinoplanes flavus]MBO3743989.1 hypothetical protein [Actinoplanes flavus]
MSDMELDTVLRGLIARADPMPEAVERYALAAFAFRTADEDFADLEWDSLIDAETLTRGPDDTRMLVFGPAGPDGVRIHLGVTRTAGGFELDGSVEPAGHTEAELLHHGGTVRRPIDSAGRFDVDLPAVRSFRVRLRGAATPVVTGWVAIG